MTRAARSTPLMLERPLSLQQSGARPISEVSALRPRDPLGEQLDLVADIRHPIDAAVHCLRAVHRVAAFQSALFCVEDMETGAVVVVHASGPEASQALLTWDASDAEPSYTASCVRHAFVHTYGESCRRAQRHRFMRASNAVLVGPVVSWNRCLATFELIGPSSGVFEESVRRAVGRAADRYAKYLDDRGIVCGFAVQPRHGGYVLRER